MCGAPQASKSSCMNEWLVCCTDSSAFILINTLIEVFITLMIIKMYLKKEKNLMVSRQKQEH